MKKLFLINGKGGSGKNTISELLYNHSQESVLVHTDNISKTNPYKINEEHLNLIIKNTCSLINNYYDAKYKCLIFTGGINSQKHLDTLLEKIEHKFLVYYIWLEADDEVRNQRKIKRNRDEADKAKHFDFVESLIHDPGVLQVENGKYIRINTNKKTPKAIFDEILQLCTLEKNS